MALQQAGTLERYTQRSDISNTQYLSAIGMLAMVTGAAYGVDQPGNTPTESNAIGTWGGRQVGQKLPVIINQVPVTINGQLRIYDGEFITGGYIEIKASVSTFKKSIGMSSRINREIALDAQLLPRPTWVFVGKPPSAGLKQSLEKNDIPWMLLDTK